MKKKKIGKKYNISHYDAAYFSERDFIPDYLVDALCRYLRRHNVLHILEVGVGSGVLMKILRQNGFTVSGIDISPISAKLTGAKVASATDIPYPNQSFDAVIAISLIEHLDDKDGNVFLQEVCRVLKKKGLIFFVTPNFASPLRYIKGRKWFGYNDPTHIYFYTPSSIRELLTRYGFKNVQFRFPVNNDVLDWPLPKFVLRLPAVFRKFINDILIASPVAYIRDSFWVGATREA